MNMNLSNSAPVLLSAAVALALSGCAEKRSCSTAHVVAKAPKVVAVVDDKDSQIAALEAAIAQARNKTIVKEVSGEGSMYPPNAEPGKCYARVLTPAKYEVKTEKVLAKDASERLQVIPAKYSWTTKKVLVKEWSLADDSSNIFVFKK